MNAGSSASSTGDESELGKNVRKAFEGLTNREFEEADRQFRVAGCSGGRSFTAFKMGKPERSVYQGLKALERLEGEDEHFPKERVVVLKSVKVSKTRLRRKLLEGNLNPSRRDRVERLLERADPWVDNVSWGEVNTQIRELSEKWLSVFSGLLAEVGEGKEYRDKEIEKGLELIREGKLDEGFDVFYELHHAFPDDEFLGATWAVSPGFIPEYVEEVGKSEFERSCKEIVEMAGESNKEEELEVFGLSLFNLSFYYRPKRGGIRDFLTEEATVCFDRSLKLGGEEGFLRYHLGLCHALLGNHETAIEHYDRVPKENSPWGPLAERSKRRSRMRLEKIKTLMEDAENLEKAEEAEGEGDGEAELRHLEEVDNISHEFFNSGAIRVRKAELRIELGKNPAPSALQKPIETDPDNEKIIKYLRETGARELERGEPAKAAEYFKLVPEKQTNDELLKMHGEALEESKRYERAAARLGEVGKPDGEVLLSLARCHRQMNELEEEMADIRELFRRSDSIPALEEALRRASRVGEDREVLQLCERLLNRSEDNPVAREIKKNIQKKIEEERRKKYSRQKEKALQMYDDGEYGRAIERLSGIPDKFIGNPARKVLADSLKREGNLERAANQYRKLPENPENLASEVHCLLMDGRREEASNRSSRLKDAISGIEDIPNPDVRGFMMEEEGRFLQAKEEYESEALLKGLSERAEALGMIQKKILVLEKLYKKFRKGYGETLKRSVGEHEDEMSIRFKARLDLELRGKEIVVCDTNVWVHKLFNGIDEFSEGNPEIAKQFDRLSGEGNRMLMTGTVRNELERLIPGLIKDEELGDGSKKTVRTRLERYVEKYAPKGLVEGSLLDPEHVERARKFYQNHPFKLKRITEEKIERNPGRRNELLLKRVGSASLTRERGSEGVLGNPMPEENDIRILAECLKLNGLSISGVSKISILSDDSDFKEFSKEIGEEFNIGVHKPTS